MDLYERRVEVPLPTVLRRSSAFGIRARFLNKGTSCWLGSLLQALFSSAAMQCALLLHRCRAGLPCALCALTTTEENSRRIEQVYCIQSLWKPLVEDAQLSWREQQDPLQFFLKLCALAHTFFAPMFGASLDTTVTQTLPCQCGVELPEPHVFPRQLEYIVPLKVPRSADGPLNMEALMGMMQEERPENAMKCPICDAQAGFLAKHAWSFGPLVLFQLTRSIGSKTAVDLEAELDVLGRCYALRACVCVTEAKPILATTFASFGNRPRGFGYATMMLRCQFGCRNFLDASRPIVRLPCTKRSLVTSRWQRSACPLFQFQMMLLRRVPD